MFKIILNPLIVVCRPTSVRRMHNTAVEEEEMGETGIDSDLQLHSLSGQSSG